MLVVEPAQVGEVRALIDLAYEHMDRDMDPEWLADQVARGACIVARNVMSDAIVGFAVARREEGLRSQLVALAVDRSFRNQGIGTALLRAIKEHMTIAGAMSMHLHVRCDNDRAQAFYARHGFYPCGLSHETYADGQPALELERPL